MLSIWTGVDPLSDKYPGISAYAYCGNNPVMMMDPDGREAIYDMDGNFLGTDDKGINGGHSYFIMDKKHFKQGMSQLDVQEYSNIDPITSEARQKIWDHAATLSSRPDEDGFVTIAEGIAWAKQHPNALDNPTADNTLYIDAAKCGFGSLSVSNIGLSKGEKDNVNLLNYTRPLGFRSRNTTYALGNTQIQLLDPQKGSVRLFNDNYDWNFHNSFNKSGMPIGKRDWLIFMERNRAGLNDSHGFPLVIFGTGKIKTR